jgi:predicted ArsR family transcriptional regulator
MPEDAIGAIALLDDPARARMYEFIRRADAPVTREQVASELGISAKLAAFHLDKLAGAGLLATHFERPPGRSGPGAGRTAKHYRPSAMELDVSIPARRYELVASVLADAVKSSPGSDPLRAAIRLARRRGREAARDGSSAAPAPAPATARSRQRPAIERIERLLRDQGYDPRRSSGSRLELANCPYRTVAVEAPEVVCAMNQAFIQGLASESGGGVRARLDPAPGRCCVVLEAAG